MEKVKVKTLKMHINGYPPVPVKNVGRHYMASARDAANLASAGTVQIIDDEDQPSG